MLARDTHVARVKIERKDNKTIIDEISLSSLLQLKRKLLKMAERGEINLTAAELNLSFGASIQRLATMLNQQIIAADLWQTEDKCPQCKLELMPLIETCVCGCKIKSQSDRLNTNDLNFLISENCTEQRSRLFIVLSSPNYLFFIFGICLIYKYFWIQTKILKHVFAFIFFVYIFILSFIVYSYFFMIIICMTFFCVK